MRNTDERMAEICRRSEVIFEARRQRRKHILMACIPLVLCVSLFSAFILPAMMPAGSSDEQYADGTWEDDVTDLFAGFVEVSGKGVSHSYTHAEDVQRIMGLINGIVATPETSEDNELKDYNSDESTSADRNEEHKENGYKILVSRGDGTTAEYFLVGSQLIDQRTHMEHRLTVSELADLKKALDIS